MMKRDGPGRARGGFAVALRDHLGDNLGVQTHTNETVGQGDGPGQALGRVPPPAGAVVAAVAALAAAWIAAGSTGLLGGPLRRALTLLAIGVAVVACRPVNASHLRRLAHWLLILPAAYMVTLPLPVANIMAPAILLVCLAFLSAGQRKDTLLTASTAVVVFGLYRLAVTSVPWFWLAADLLGRGCGQVAGSIVSRPLWVGATFAGLDFLVLTSVLWGLFLYRTKPPRARRAVYGFLGIIGGHLAYLVLLSFVPDIRAAAAPDGGNGARGSLVQLLLPWNVPAVAGVIHLLIVAAMFRWSAWASNDGQSAGSGVSAAPQSSYRSRLFLPALAVVMAVLLPAVATLYPHSLSLGGKKIVFYEKGYLNWLKPTHGSYGRLSSGMYGMLPVFIESLGAESVVSPDLSEVDLQDADVLVLLFPDERWQEGQRERIETFVRRGGSLLVMGEHTTRDATGANRFNEVLAPTAMQVRFDSATFAVGGWLQSYEAMSHPVTAGVSDERNQFGVVIGASVETRWPARPLLMGTWGWNDPGDEASARAMMGNGRYDPGEKLGDVVLAAEQPLGKGRVIAFGDTSGLTNAINVSSHVFTARLFAYLAGGGPRMHPAWRQCLALLIGVFLGVLLCRRPGILRTGIVAIALTASLAVCAQVNQASARVLPDGRLQRPNNLAYIDASHVEAYSSESWRPDGIGGLALTLMRNGYLTLTAPDLTPERLERASLLVSIAPFRPFSQTEIETVRGFVEAGGTLIMTAGYEEAGERRPLLDAFGFAVGIRADKTAEPEPMGHFKAPYLESQSRRVYVRFHAAWPITCNDGGARVIAYGKNNRPVIMMREVGAGRAILIGDPCFAMNKNLENENGAPFEGLRENADFWRWFITLLRDEEIWVPPSLRSEPTEGGAQP